MNKELLVKYLNNCCSEAELDEVLKWIRTDAYNEDVKNWSLEIWNSVNELISVGADESFDSIFDKIQKRIEKDNASNQTKESIPLKRSIVFNWITRAAAILLIPALSIIFYIISKEKIEFAKYASLTSDSLEVIAPIGSKTVVQLSDGTEVHLNYGSKIKYPHFFVSDTREVVLTGEAFFNVAHNPERPFIVKTRDFNIKVVGTSFNVLAYPDNDVIETTLVTGKVLLEQVSSEGNIRSIGIMNPGMHAEYNTQIGSISLTEGKIEKYISWTDGKLIFEDTPISEVTEKLSRMYNVDFEVSPEIENYIYTVTFTDEPLFQILDLMTIATPVVFKVLPRNKLPDGTYSKQKIVLNKR